LILAECSARKFPWDVSKDVFAYSKQLETLEINFKQHSKTFNNLIKDCLIWDPLKRLNVNQLLEKYFSKFQKDKCDATVLMLRKLTEVLTIEQRRLSEGGKKKK
jgi:serine/threonine protein kinase